MLSKQELLRRIKELNPNSPQIFKSSKDIDYSLTDLGFNTIIKLKLYPEVFIEIINKDVITLPKTLISIRKIFNSPYFVDKSSIHHFDSSKHSEIMMYGGFIEFIKINYNIS